MVAATLILLTSSQLAAFIGIMPLQASVAYRRQRKGYAIIMECATLQTGRRADTALTADADRTTAVSLIMMKWQTQKDASRISCLLAAVSCAAMEMRRTKRTVR